MDRVLVALPAFDEAPRVGAVLAGVLALRIPGAALEAVVVDDGSGDGTAEAARSAGARVLRLDPHRGVGAALAAAFELARAERFDYLVHLDADGQIDPAHIPALLAPVRSGRADAAIGSRFLAGRPEYLSALKAALLRLLARAVGTVVGTRLSDLSCGIRCLGPAAIEAARPRFGADYVQETLLQFFAARLRVVEVPVTATARRGGRSLSAAAFAYTARYLLLLAYALASYSLTRAAPRPRRAVAAP